MAKARQLNGLDSAGEIKFLIDFPFLIPCQGDQRGTAVTRASRGKRSIEAIKMSLSTSLPI